jgi:hypothetical protein
MSDEKFKIYVNDFIRLKGYESAQKYILYIFSLVSEMTTSKPSSNIIKFDEDNKELINFMNGISINIKERALVDEEANIRSNPIYRLTNEKYAVLSYKFLVDKLFHGMIFDMASELSSSGVFSNKKTGYQTIKQQIGERFSEQYILYKTLENTLSRRFSFYISGQSLHKILKKGEPDYYARRSRRIFLFEFKDIQLNASIKDSCDYETIRAKLYESFVENEKGKPKGIKQLYNVINESLPKILRNIDKVVPINDKFQIYPIIVYTDNSFDIEGINYYINKEFQSIKALYQGRYTIKDVVMVNLNILMQLENLFTNGKISFDKVLINYLSHKQSCEKLNCIPFGKYLYQYAMSIGFDMKFSNTSKKTIDELGEFDKK